MRLSGVTACRLLTDLLPQLTRTPVYLILYSPAKIPTSLTLNSPPLLACLPCIPSISPKKSQVHPQVQFCPDPTYSTARTPRDASMITSLILYLAIVLKPVSSPLMEQHETHQPQNFAHTHNTHRLAQPLLQFGP